MPRSYQLDIHRCTNEDCICPAAEEGYCTTEGKYIPAAYSSDAFPDFCKLPEKEES